MVLYYVVVQLASGRGTIAMRPDGAAPALLAEWEARAFADLLREEEGVVSAIVVPLVTGEDRGARARAVVEAQYARSRERLVAAGVIAR